MFDKSLFFKEMYKMVNKAMRRMETELPHFKIYTINIWTDANAAASAINFDSKAHSLESIKQQNVRLKKYYKYFASQGNLEAAAGFKPNKKTRVFNPADFELRCFEETDNKSFQKGWEHKTNGRCWQQLEPALIEIGDYAFMLSKVLELEKGFELSINSKIEWYDTTWRENTLPSSRLTKLSK